MEILYKMLDLVLAGWLTKRRARQEFSSEFEALKRGVLYENIVSDLPVRMHQLREFFIQRGLVGKQDFKEFFERWLTNPVVVMGRSANAPGLFTQASISELQSELSKLRI